MVLIHRLIRRGIQQASALVRRPGATVRSPALSAYIGFHLDGLRAHHSTEDELLWPALLDRVAVSGALVERMERQHADLHESLELARRELEAWAEAPTASGAERLAAALDAVDAGLAEHLAEEERDIVPLIAAHITQAEWDHLGQVAFGKFTPAQRFTAMGELLATATPGEAARMMAGLPAPVKVVWRLLGRRRYERLMADARG